MKISIDALKRFLIGREDDGGVCVVEIDCATWKEKYPQLTDCHVEAKSPAGVVYFPIVRMEGNVLVWEITQHDTAAHGFGAYQVVATDADGQKKTSEHASFVVMGVIAGTAGDEPPDPAKPWTDKVMEAAKWVEAAELTKKVLLVRS